MSERTPQEADQVPARTVLAVGAAGIVVTLLVAALAWWLARPARPLPPRAAAAIEQGLMDQADRAERLTARKRQLLDSAGWVDRDRGIAHIPIDDAIELLLARSQP